MFYIQKKNQENYDFMIKLIFRIEQNFIRMIETN